MTFFQFKEKDIISVEYTAYPTRSFSMTRQGADDEYRIIVPLYTSGSTVIGQNRTFFDINGNPLSQSYYSSAKIRLMFNKVLTGSSLQTKTVVNQLRTTYGSSSFYKTENFSSASIYNSSVATSQTMAVLSIPSMLIGSGIKPNSFVVSDPNDAVLFRDDGYGGIYSGTVLMGCIFYEYGLAYFGQNAPYSKFGQQTSIKLYFSATNHVPMNVYICDAPKGMLNFSNNSSYSKLSGTKYEITTENPKTFITTIGLYDKNFELVGLAKISTPLLNQETDNLQFRLKLNF